MPRFLKATLKAFITTVLFFAVAEVALRAGYTIRNARVRRVVLPYALGDEYGPIPPWLDRLLILVPDDSLIWHAVPHARRTYVDVFTPAATARDRIALLRRFTPWLPDEFQRKPTWSIALNAEGFRARELDAALPSRVRIACIGDSWTFGMNVDQDRTYPARLAARLETLHPDTRFDVLNLGVLGYSSFQGLQLLTRRVMALHPDVVAIGFGMNDSEVAGYRDKDMIGADRPAVAQRLGETLQDLEIYKLLDYFALALKFRPKSVGDYLKEDATETASGPTDYDAIEPWTRVSPRDYEDNIRSIVRLATAAGARVVLLDNELWSDSPYRMILKRVSAELGLPFVDSYQLVADARAKMARDLESALGLDSSGSPGRSPGPTDRVTVIFRVRSGSYAVPSAMSITGSDPQLGDYVPNTVTMNDEGAGGDQRAGDGVWSYSASFVPGTRVFYVYTNSGGRGRWEGLDVPTIRQIVVPPSVDGRPVYLPIETFGKIDMQADNWHPDAAGYELIANAVADSLK